MMHSKLLICPKTQVYSDIFSEIKEISIYGKKVNQKKGQTPKRIEFQVTGALFTPIERRVTAMKSLGFFIIATNDLDSNMTIKKMLKTYKEQLSVEKGFRFLKSPNFLIRAQYSLKNQSEYKHY